MFENIGNKLKGLAKVVCWVGIIVSVGAGIAMMACDPSWRYGLAIGGLAILIVGPFISWVSSFFIYGFGELIQNSAEIRYILMRQENPDLPASAVKTVVNRNEQLDALLKKGLITQEEYDQKMNGDR